jgi:high-affinity iron transporter
MVAAFLITFREILEASLIIATIIGILSRLQHKQSIKTVWLATSCAIGSSLGLLILGSLFGLRINQLFEQYEALFEGVIMVISAFFITWAVFFLHRTFGHYKLVLLQKVRSTMEKNSQRSIFLLVFTAVFREGFEIILFLSTSFFSNQPFEIILGFGLGSLLALMMAFLLFRTSINLPIFYTFRLTSLLLILFAAGLLAHGYHELTEAGLLTYSFNLPSLTFHFIPEKSTFLGSVIRAVFGLGRTMHTIEFALWSGYTILMSWIIFIKPVFSKQQSVISNKDQQ